MAALLKECIREEQRTVIH